MTGKLLFLILLLTVLVFVPAVNAQTTTATDSATKLKQQLQLMRSDKKNAVTQARDEFKTRIQTIKDQKKKLLVERIDAKLAEINKKQTTKFTDALIRLQGFLDKIKQSTTDTKILTDVSAAQIIIDTAKAAVDIQAAKTYTMEITDDLTLKLNAGTVISQLRQDLTAVHKLVVDAKQAVQKLNTDRKLMKKEATGSANL